MAKKVILKEVDRELYRIGRRISFLAVNPVNEWKERKKFFSSRSYEPIFRYSPPRINIDAAISRLDSLKMKRSYVGQILRHKRDSYVRTLNMLGSVGSEDFKASSLKVYGRPGRTLVKKARRILRYREGQKKSAKLSPKEVADMLREALKVYGFNWEVRQKLMTANAAVQQSKRRVLLKKGKMFSNDFIRRLIAHEIGTHVLRYENGMLQPYRVFASGLPGYLETEEGLAAVNEEKAGVLSKGTLRVYAGRVVAVHLAQDHSFREVYNRMKTHFSRDKAWRITVRAKRGLSDTSQHGGLTKDYKYLNGYFKVKNYLKKYSIDRLYYGKVSVYYARFIDRIPDLVEPRYLPRRDKQR